MLNRYVVTPSFGYTQCAPRVYVEAEKWETAVTVAQAITPNVTHCRPTHWPVALVTSWPEGAKVHGQDVLA